MEVIVKGSRSVDRSCDQVAALRLAGDLPSNPGIASHPVLPGADRVSAFPEDMMSQFAPAILVTLKVLGRDHPEHSVWRPHQRCDEFGHEGDPLRDDRSVIGERVEIGDDHRKLFPVQLDLL